MQPKRPAHEERIPVTSATRSAPDECDHRDDRSGARFRAIRRAARIPRTGTQCFGNPAGIINNILDFSRIESGQVDFEQIPFNPQGMCRSRHRGRRRKRSHQTAQAEQPARSIRWSPTHWLAIRTESGGTAQPRWQRHQSLPIRGFVSLRIELLSRDETEVVASVRGSRQRRGHCSGQTGMHLRCLQRVDIRQPAVMVAPGSASPFPASLSHACMDGSR